jgi:hypothetical protein
MLLLQVKEALILLISLTAQNLRTLDQSLAQALQLRLVNPMKALRPLLVIPLKIMD